jgi:hypothetical protein
LVDSNVAVGEDEEVSIKQVADAIVKAVGYEGDYKVRPLLVDLMFFWTEVMPLWLVRHHARRRPIPQACIKQKAAGPHRRFRIHAFRQGAPGYRFLVLAEL